MSLHAALRVGQRPTLWTALLTLAAFALRLYHLDAMSFWSDEGISVLRARQDLPTLFATLPVEHTPLYFVALHVWMALTGAGDFAVRYFSLLFSVLIVPLVYKLGDFIDRGRKTEDGSQLLHPFHRPLASVGLLAALLAALNPLQVWYAQEARMYTLFVALCAGAAWCLLKGRETEDDRWKTNNDSPSSVLRPPSRYDFAFALLTAAALYTHFFAALIVAAFALWALFAVWRDKLDWRPLAASFALIGLLFLPWLPRAIAALSFPGWQAAADPLSLPARYLVAYTLGSTIGDEWRWLSLIFLLLLVVGVVVLVRRREATAWLPICYVCVPFALLMLLALRKPGYHERYLIVITPMLFVIGAAGLERMRNAYAVMRNLRIAHHAPRIVFTIAMLFVIVTSAYALNNLYFDPRFAKPDFRAAAQYIDRQSRAGDGLIFDGPDPNKAFYRYFSRQRVTTFDEQDFDAQDADEAVAFLSAQAPSRERWWVVLYFHPPGPTEDWLLQRGYLASSRWFNGIRVLLYATPSETSLRTFTPLAVQTQLPLQIVQVRARPQVQAGDVLPVIVTWQPSAPLLADYQVSLRLVNEEGNVVKQLDRRPLDGRLPTSQWKVGEPLEDRYGLLVPDKTSTGTYQVELILYMLNSGEALHANLLSSNITQNE